MAYFVARFYYWLNSQHGWRTDAAGAVSLLVMAPLLGVFLYFFLFQFIRGKSTLIKLVATIGLSVALPPGADFLFGTQAITSAPGLASLSDQPFHFLGAPVTTDQVITYGFVLFVVLARDVGVAVDHCGFAGAGHGGFGGYGVAVGDQPGAGGGGGVGGVGHSGWGGRGAGGAY